MSKYSTASLQANRFVTKPTEHRDAYVYSRPLDEDYAPLDFDTFSYTYLDPEADNQEGFDYCRATTTFLNFGETK
jgi:hypothetical protein